MRTPNLRNRLILIFSAILITVTAASLINLMLMTQQQEKLQSLFRTDLGLQQKVEQLRHAILVTQHQVLRAALEGDEDLLKDFTGEDNRFFQLAEEVKIQAKESEMDLAEPLQAIKEDYRRFISSTLGLSTASAEKTRRHDGEPEQMQRIYGKLNERLDRLVNDTHNHLNQGVTGIQRISANSIQIHWLLLIAIVSVVIGALLALEKRLTVPVARLEAFLERIGGEREALAERLPVDGTDEISHIGNAVNRMLDNLQETTVSRDSLEKSVAERTHELTHEIAEREQAEKELRLAATVFETTSEGLMVTNSKNEIQAVNSAFCRITGFSEQEAIGQDPNFLSSGYHDADFFHAMWEALKSRGHWEGEIWNRRRNGERFPAWLSISAVESGDSDKNGQYVAVLRDITQRKRNEEQILRQANFDELTDLPNRTLFLERLTRAIATVQREQGMLALMFIDLDNFKAVNDTLGHDVGDSLLKEAATRLQDSIRETDTVARFGGDEFTIVLQMINSGEDAARVAEKIIQNFAEPFRLNGDEAFVGTSIGITLYPNDGSDPNVLLRNADMAMYQAKSRGRNQCHFFTREMNTRAQMRMKMEQELRHALEQDQFTLHYQPIITLETGNISGVEALIRWNNPTRGLLHPPDFIALAAETGIIEEISEWALRTACRQGRLWQEEGLPPLVISVNLAGSRLTENFPGKALKQILDETGLSPQLLGFEITEGTLIKDADTAAQRLQTLRDMGIALTIDDFGTGHSSLSYLKRLPVDGVKIDPSVIQEISADPDGISLVQAFIAMAHSLGLASIAEGVETREQFILLQSLNCELAQGYYFTPPVPADEFARLLAENRQSEVSGPIGPAYAESSLS